MVAPVFTTYTQTPIHILLPNVRCGLLAQNEQYQIQGVKNIGRWTQFCDPLKKKDGMNSLEGISWKINGIQDMYHNNSINLEATFEKLCVKN